MGCRSDLASAIKSALTMEQVAERYGFTPTRSSFIRCPFHQGDDHGSLKLYPEDRGFHCFGCGASGSVIDFVMLLYGVPFREACARLNADFGLGLSMDKPSRAEMSRLVRKRQAEAKQREKQKRRELELFDNECRITAAINQAEIAMKEHPPTSNGWEAVYPDEWVDAVRRLDKLRMELWENDLKQDKMRTDKRQLSELEALPSPKSATDNRRRSLQCG